MSKHSMAALLISLLSFNAVHPAAAAPPPGQKFLGTPVQFRQNPEVLISYRKGQAEQTQKSVEAAGFEIVEDYQPGNYFRCRAKEGVRSVASAANRIAASDLVRFVEPNFRVGIPEPAGPQRPAAAVKPAKAVPAAVGNEPDDPLFDKLWGMKSINASQAWDNGTSSPVVVGVVDSGVDYTHEDLKENMWVNVGEIPNDGVDNDGNGVVDDVHGARYENGEASGDPMDDNAHGTHCAGTIGAVGDNATGVAGVNWKIKIMALKFLDAGGSGFTNDAIRCIDYAVQQKERGVNIRVLSNSWGGGGRSVALQEAITRAEEAGILFVAAASNDSSDNDAIPSFPSNYDNENVIAVASINIREGLSWFSNFGKTTVDLAAPGGTLEGEENEDIWSTVPVKLDTDDEDKDGYAAFAGTSMAAPHVSGAIALAWASSTHAGKTPNQMKALILDNARPLTSLTGLCVTGATLDISFLKDTSPGAVVGPFVYAGNSETEGGGFELKDDKGTANYVLGGSAYQSNLKFVEEGDSPDGYRGWIYREDYPNFPFDFLFTQNTIGNVGYYRIYVRPADDLTAPFLWFCDSLRGYSAISDQSATIDRRHHALQRLRLTN